MAYVAANLHCLVPRVGQDGNAIWALEGTDVHTDADAADFISDGDDRGMRVGDFLFYRKTTATIGGTLHTVETVTAGGAATISAAILA